MNEPITWDDVGRLADAHKELARRLAPLGILVAYLHDEVTLHGVGSGPWDVAAARAIINEVLPMDYKGMPHGPIA